MCSVKEWSGRAGRVEVAGEGRVPRAAAPAAVFNRVQEDWLGGAGSSALVGWLSGSCLCWGGFSSLPLHLAPRFLPGPLYPVTRWEQSKKGDSHQATRAQSCCAMKLRAKSDLGIICEPHLSRLYFISLSSPAFVTGVNMII